ncbi:MAG: phytoene/squalene synthase family protein [Paracoccaceae bacterium]|nr:phytoene/squalene synthase family protein [Paracoccaceae bacterium]
MIDPRDLARCRDAIRHGSLSFYTASRLLPARVRDPALALYAFCRLSDDAVDLGHDKTSAVLHLRDRLGLIYEGRPHDAPADRAFAAVIEEHQMPRALPDALLEGLAWDAQWRQYETLSGVFDYSARVAAAVGAMMAVLMGVRDAAALARACDLGVAMQLTNIARDVGEDARAGRLYLPLDWMEEAGLDPRTFFADPVPDARVRAMTKRLLRTANRLYLRAETGIPALPLSARPGIYAARHVYAGIGGAIEKNGFDTISYRARTYKGQKLGWLGLALLRSGVSVAMPRSPVVLAEPLEETRFLVDAAARAPARSPRSRALADVLTQLEAADRDRRSALLDGRRA